MTIIINKPDYANFESSKGHGQVKKLGREMGWEMNYSLNNGDADRQWGFATKTEAKEVLKNVLDQ